MPLTTTAEMRQRVRARALRRNTSKESKSDYEDFMDDCIDQLGDEEMCQIIWDEMGD